jgi:hypothetical protein
MWRNVMRTGGMRSALQDEERWRAILFRVAHAAKLLCLAWDSLTIDIRLPE